MRKGLDIPMRASCTQKDEFESASLDQQGAFIPLRRGWAQRAQCWIDRMGVQGAYAPARDRFLGTLGWATFA